MHCLNFINLYKVLEDILKALSQSQAGHRLIKTGQIGKTSPELFFQSSTVYYGEPVPNLASAFCIG